jgi:hypothetical protein
MAQSKGDWTVSAGVHQVAPKSNNGWLAGHTLKVDVDNDVKPTITGEYFIADNLGIEVLAAAVQARHQHQRPGPRRQHQAAAAGGDPAVPLQQQGQGLAVRRRGRELHDLLQRRHHRCAGRQQAEAAGFVGPGRACGVDFAIGERAPCAWTCAGSTSTAR